MFVDFNCSNCGKKLRQDEKFIGKKAKCPACMKTTVVPDLKETEEKPVEEQANSPVDEPKAETPVEEIQQTEPEQTEETQDEIKEEVPETETDQHEDTPEAPQDEVKEEAAEEAVENKEESSEEPKDEKPEEEPVESVESVEAVQEEEKEEAPSSDLPDELSDSNVQKLEPELLSAMEEAEAPKEEAPAPSKPETPKESTPLASPAPVKSNASEISPEAAQQRFGPLPAEAVGTIILCVIGGVINLFLAYDLAKDIPKGPEEMFQYILFFGLIFSGLTWGAVIIGGGLLLSRNPLGWLIAYLGSFLAMVESLLIAFVVFRVSDPLSIELLRIEETPSSITFVRFLLYLFSGVGIAFIIWWSIKAPSIKGCFVRIDANKRKSKAKKQK